MFFNVQMAYWRFFLFISLFILQPLRAQKTCSRVAKINFQDVLVDTSSSRKGEGIKFYLEKDPQAKSFYDRYLDNQKDQLIPSLLGTLGVGLILTGILKSNSSDNENRFKDRGIWVAAGAVTLGVNYILANIRGKQNEKNLHSAVEEYNKRNLPKIYFGPFINQYENERNSNSRKFGIQGQLRKEF